MDWPVSLTGVTESIVTTLGPNERYNVAALGLHAGDDGVTARTWGRTRTWRNFSEQGTGFVQFTGDPVVFADAALDIREQDDPILDSSDAWVEVEVEQIDNGTEGGTHWVDWEVTPVDADVVQAVVPTYNRGYGAVVEATIAASRFGVEGYDDEVLRERIEYFGAVVDRCGGPREREAFDRVVTHVPE